MPISVNEQQITDESIYAEMQYHPAASAQEAVLLAGQALAIRALLLQEAGRLKIELPATHEEQDIQEDFLISRLLEQEVVTPEATDVECLRYYESNSSKFRDKEGNVVLFEHVKPAIAGYLADVSWQSAVKQYLKILVGQASITGIDLEGTDNALVQ